MPEAKFKIGDVVMLNSGGVKMTIYEVVDLIEFINIRCVYHSSIDDKIHITEFFKQDCLMLNP